MAAFNFNTNLSPRTDAQKDYLQRVRDYGQLLRTLRREGRQGNAQSLQAAIQVAKQAREDGIPGVQGPQNYQDRETAAKLYEKTLAENARDRERANMMASRALGSGAYTQDELDNLFRPEEEPPAASTGQEKRPRLGYDSSRIDMGGRVVETARGPLAQARRALAQRIEGGETFAEGELRSEQRRLGISDSAMSRFMGRSGNQDTSEGEAYPQGAATEPVGRSRLGYDSSRIDMGGRVVESASGPLAQARRDLAQRIEGGTISGDELRTEKRRLGISDNAMSRFMGSSPTAGQTQSEKPWGLAEEARAAIPRYLGAVDKINSATAGIEQQGYESAMDRAERAGQRADRPKPPRTTVQSAEEQIAAANREVDQVVPEARPYSSPSGAELAGRVAGGFARKLEGIGERNLLRGLETGETNLDAIRGLGERNLNSVRGLGERNLGRANRAATSAWEALKRFREGFSQNTR